MVAEVELPTPAVASNSTVADQSLLRHDDLKANTNRREWSAAVHDRRAEVAESERAVVIPEDVTPKQLPPPHPPHPKSPGLIAKVIFGMACSLGFNALMVTNGTLIDYYESSLGLSSNFLSVTDFIVGVCAVYALLGFGYMSDSTVSRYGRRKPYVLALTPILVFSLAMLYNPSSFPAEQTHVWFAAYYFLTQCSMYGLTVVISAWGNALTHAPDERSSLYSIDAMSDLIGYFVGVILTSICTESTGAIILAFIFLVENYLLVKFVPNEPLATGSAAKQVPFIPGVHLSLRNHQLVALLLATTFGSIVGTTINLMPLFFEFVMQVPTKEVEHTYSRYVNTVTGCALVTVLLASYLNRRWGKLKVVRLAIVSGIIFGVMAFATSYGHVRHFFLTSVPAGIFGGIIMVNGNVLLADAIDYDELMTGFRRQSMCQCLMYAPFTFISVAGSSIPLTIMSMAGSINLAQEHNDNVVMILRLWVSVVVSVSLCFSYYFMKQYALSETVQEKVSSQLQRLADGEVFRPCDPLLERPNEFDAGVQIVVEEEEDGGEMSMPSPCSWEFPGTFLDLYFTERELALIAIKNGRRAVYMIHLCNTSGTLVYMGVFVWRTSSAFRAQDLIAGEIFICLLVLLSIFLVYDVGRHRAFHELHTLTDRDVMKWAKRRLTARAAPMSRLRQPFAIIYEVAFTHALMLGLTLGVMYLSTEGLLH